jgi:hypothetical protein
MKRFNFIKQVEDAAIIWRVGDIEANYMEVGLVNWFIS